MIRRLLLPCVLIIAATTALAANLLKPGDPFPPWTLVDQTGAKVSSTDLAGKRYLIWFYPRAMTPGCTAEGNGLRDQFAAFQSQGVEIVGVSFDSAASNAAFVREQQFPFRLLSDSNRQLALAVGAAEAPDQATARRISYLVSPDGKVLRAYASVSPATHAQDVLSDLTKPTSPH